MHAILMLNFNNWPIAECSAQSLKMNAEILGQLLNTQQFKGGVWQPYNLGGQGRIT